MSLIVKICGLSTEETLDAAIAAGADMVGLNVFAKSPRFVTPPRAAELAARVKGRAEIVAITVDADDAALDAIVEMVQPDWLQLHGSESVERVRTIRKRSGRQVMKAVGIADPSDLARAGQFIEVADGLLLDAKAPTDADRPGGHGRAFDWTILAGFDPGLPWLLSGGLRPGNVGEAIRISGAPGVDVSSGVESAPGRKEPDLIRGFITVARSGEAPAMGRHERAAS